MMKYPALIILLFVLTNTYGQKVSHRIIHKTDTVLLKYKDYFDSVVDGSYQVGFVTIKVDINQEGTVIHAEPVLEESIIMDTLLIKAAQDAALKLKFRKKRNANQIGFIKYGFKVIDEESMSDDR